MVGGDFNFVVFLGGGGDLGKEFLWLRYGKGNGKGNGKGMEEIYI